MLPVFNTQVDGVIGQFVGSEFVKKFVVPPNQAYLKLQSEENVASYALSGYRPPLCSVPGKDKVLQQKLQPGLSPPNK